MTRPAKLSDFLGQEKAKERVELILRAGKIKKQSVDHVLLYGFAGTGKTTLANIIANEQGGQMFSINGGSIKTKKDILSLLRGLDRKSEYCKDVVFIDEIHRLSFELAEEFYSVLEDRKMFYIFNGETVTINFPKFTLVGATTEVGTIPKPLLDRFIHKIELKPYTDLELAQIVTSYIEKQGMNIDKDNALSIAKRSKGTPRIAINNASSCIATTIAKRSELNNYIINYTFDMMGIDELGLTDLDRRYLELIEERPKGLNTLSQTLMEAKDTVTKMIEPYLSYLEFVEFTSRGRMISPAGKKYLAERRMLKKTKEREEIILA